MVSDNTNYLEVSNNHIQPDFNQRNIGGGNVDITTTFVSVPSYVVNKRMQVTEVSKFHPRPGIDLI